jgi:predicted ATPase
VATRFGQDVGVVILTQRSLTLWVLGYPEAALSDADHAVKDAREIGHAPTLMYALFVATVTHILLGSHAVANTLTEEGVALADERDVLRWKAEWPLVQGCLFALTGNISDGVQVITSGIAAHRSTGSTNLLTFFLPRLARTHAELGQFDDAWCCIGEAITAVETTKERWCEADIHRTAGEIALMSPEPDPVKAEAYFERALVIARAQQAKSWELRAAMSIARLRRDQGKRQQAHDLLAPVYGWFNEGFDTLDLRDAKALLEQLAA